MTKLSAEDFLNVVTNTPLVSIDFVIENDKNQYLVGKRINDPAKDYWFVPGGRIYKNETIKNAIARLMKEELAIDHFHGKYKLLGTYEHMYDTCFYKFNPYFTSTHYIVLGIKIHITEDIDCIDILTQHSTYCWMNTHELITDPMVHDNTKNYFRGMTDELIDF